MFRRWFSWVIAGAVVAVGVLAGVDAVRSSGGESPPPSAERERAVTTAPKEAAAVLLTGDRPVRLQPGRVSTDLDSSPVVTFVVPPGWYGYQDETGFVLGMGLVSEEVDLFPGGITVYVLELALADAARRLEQVEDVQVKPPVRIGGSVGRRYARRLGLFHDETPRDLGLPGVAVPRETDLILLGAGRQTLVIRREFMTDADADRAEVNGVLMSLRSPG
jgi:hypothetical protein